MQKNNGYEVLANVYDGLNRDIDYSEWADFLEEIFRRYSDKKISSIVDLGCGTGSMTLELAKRKYDMIGIDNSPDMLVVARTRDFKKSGILWLEQDITEFELYGTVDVAISCLDCVNHITDPKKLDSMFKWVNNYLEPNGLFIFDVNSGYKFENVYSDNAYILEDERSYCGWQNLYNKNTGLCTFYLTVFEEQDDGSYIRQDGIQSERYYSDRKIKNALKKNNMECLASFSSFNFDLPSDESARIYYIAKTNKQN